MADPKPPKRPTGATAQALRDAILQPASSPTVEQFLDQFFDICGGPRAVAKLMYDEFLAAPKGSLMRTRICETILRSMKFTDNAKRGPDDLGVLSDADLEKLAGQIIQRMSRDAAPA